MNCNLESAIIKLIMSERFYSQVLLRLKRIVSVDVPTLGICVKEHVDLYINPYVWQDATLEAQVDYLKHEIGHLINNHIEREKYLEPEFDRSKSVNKKDILERIKDMQNASRLNVAEDLALNEYLINLPESIHLFDKEGNLLLEPDTIIDEQGNEVPNEKAGQPQECTLCKVKELKKRIPHALNTQSMEYYYNLLKEDEKQNGSGQGFGMILLDDHSLQGDGEANSEYAREVVKGIIKEAVDACGGREAGNIPGHLLKLIDELLYQPKSWKNDLRMFVANASETKTEETRKRRNRRYGLAFPGFRHYEDLHLSLITDTSGSVSDEQEEQFRAEIIALHKLGVDITVIQCDTEVNSVFTFDPKKKFEICGRGGTILKPAFDLIEAKDYINKYGKSDGLIVFTDGDLFDSGKINKPKCATLWAILEGGRNPCSFGRTTEIIVRKK